MDDLITKVNEKSVVSREALVSTIRSYSPGQQVTLMVDAPASRWTSKPPSSAALARPPCAEIMNRMGGELSIRVRQLPHSHSA